jgi:hypothetical protein
MPRRAENQNRRKALSIQKTGCQLAAGFSLSKNQSHSLSYSRISFKKEENGSKKRIDKTLLPLPGCQLFQIHGSKLKLHPVRHLGQASVLRITHSVFFFGVCKDTFNGLFTPPVKALVLLISEDSCPRIFLLSQARQLYQHFFKL